MDETLAGPINRGQSGLGSNGNTEGPKTPLSSRAGAAPPDTVWCHT